MLYKADGWSRASSPWLLDEPSSFQDFAALKFYGELFLKGVRAVTDVAKPARMCFRADISRPQWQRDALDGVLGMNVISPLHDYTRMINDRKERFNEILFVYGSTCAPEEGAYQPVLWSLDAWSLGADGILPWQTIGTIDSWKTADATALFYPAPPGVDRAVMPVIPSLRLKGYRRGQQDIEYLVLLGRKLNLSRREIGALVRQELILAARQRKTSAEDAGTIVFAAVSARDLWQFRIRIAQMLQAASLP